MSKVELKHKSLRLQADLIEIVERMAEENNRSFSNQINQILKDALKKDVKNISP